MASVLEDLYFGRIHPCERCSSPEENELMGRLSDCFDRLSEGMTEEQRVGLENFKDCLQEISVISEREMFEYGLRLGMRLMVEVMGVGSAGKMVR